MNDNNNKDIALQGFVNDINTIINTARTNAVRSVDFCRVQMYLAFGKYVARNMQLTNVADTDKQKYYKNRDELVSVIERLGGKVSGSVSSKTSYLINNDKESPSSKNKKAKSLNIPIISEEEFIKMIQ